MRFEFEYVSALKHPEIPTRLLAKGFWIEYEYTNEDRFLGSRDWLRAEISIRRGGKSSFSYSKIKYRVALVD